MPKKRKSYGSQLGAVAPAFALKALIGDLPKGAIEKAVEAKSFGSKKSAKSLLADGVRGRGTGRALGASLGILTAPAYIGGLKLLTAKSKKEKAKGLALIGGSAAAYQGMKGLTEAYREARVANTSKFKSVLEGLRLGGIRIGYKTPAALALGLSVAAGRKKSKKGKDPSTAKKLLAPALGGAAIGALSRGGEGFAKDLLGGNSAMKSLINIKPRAIGGASGGLLGGLVLGGVIDAAMKSLEKKGSVEEMQKEASDTASQVMEKTAVVAELMAGGKALAAVLPATTAKLIGIHAGTKAGMGYGRIGQFVGKNPLGRKFQKSVELAKTRQLALGIREGIAGRQGAGLRSQILLNATMPELKIQRAAGIGIGKLLRPMTPAMRQQSLEGLARVVRNNPKARLTSRGESVAILNQLPKAVDMATGKIPMGGNRIAKKLLYGGRGGLGKGLPTAGAQDRAGIFSGENIGNLASGAAGLGTLLAVGSGAAPVGLGAAGLLAGGHMGMSGIKNLVTKTKYIQNKGTAEGARGIREAFLPGIKQTPGEKVGDKVIDYLLSPGARDYGRTVGGISTGIVSLGKKKAKSIRYQRHLNKAVGAEKSRFKETFTPAMLAAVGGGGIGKLVSDIKKKKK